MNTSTTEHKNRYGDIHTFTLQDDGVILWKGSFTFSRVGYPNNYLPAYTAYVEDKGNKSLKEFEKAIYDWDDESGSWRYPYLEKYRQMVTPDRTKLDMVDPSGGPYICVGMELMGGIVTKIESFDSGYKLTMAKNEN